MQYLACTFYKPTRAKGGYNLSYYIKPKRRSLYDPSKSPMAINGQGHKSLNPNPQTNTLYNIRPLMVGFRGLGFRPMRYSAMIAIGMLCRP